MSTIEITVEQARQKVRDALAATGLSWAQAQALFSERDPADQVSALQYRREMRTINRHLWLLDEPELGERAPVPGWLGEVEIRDRTVSVLDVAEAVLARTCEHSITGQVSTMRLQKLVFLCQAYALTLLGEPMFNAEIHAWDSGPVIPKLQKLHAGEYTVGPGFFRARPQPISREQRIVVDFVVEKFGALSGPQLAELTQEKAAWQDTYRHPADPDRKVMAHTAITRSYRPD